MFYFIGGEKKASGWEIMNFGRSKTINFDLARTTTERKNKGRKLENRYIRAIKSVV